MQSSAKKTSTHSQSGSQPYHSSQSSFQNQPQYYQNNSHIYQDQNDNANFNDFNSRQITQDHPQQYYEQQQYQQQIPTNQISASSNARSHGQQKQQSTSHTTSRTSQQISNIQQPINQSQPTQTLSNTSSTAQQPSFAMDGSSATQITRSQQQNQLSPQMQAANQSSTQTMIPAQQLTPQSSARATPPKPPISSIDSHIMYYGAKCEIKCEDTFAYYEGYVVDFNVNDRTFHVMYPWKQPQNVPVNYVRPLPPPLESPWEPQIGEHIECKARAEENEPYGWWGCVVQAIKNNLYMIVYEGWDSHNDVMTLDSLRPKNKHANLSDRGLTRKPIKLSPPQVDWVVKNNEQLQRIETKTGLIHLGYRPDAQQLILIGLKRQIDDATLLLDHIWYLLNQYAEQEKKSIEEEQKLQAEYDKLSNCCRVTFHFDTNLTGFVIGPKGSNIIEAKKIEGIEHINVKKLSAKQSECLILAANHETAEEARDHLEMEMVYEYVPKAILPDIIGASGENISQLQQSTKVSLISTLSHLKKIMKENKSSEDDGNNDNDDEVKMVIIGPKVNIPVALSALQSEVKVIAQKKQLFERSQSARHQLRQFQKDDVSAKRNTYDVENDETQQSPNYEKGQSRQRGRRGTYRSSHGGTHPRSSRAGTYQQRSSPQNKRYKKVEKQSTETGDTNA